MSNEFSSDGFVYFYQKDDDDITLLDFDFDFQFFKGAILLVLFLLVLLGLGQQPVLAADPVKLIDQLKTIDLVNYADSQSFRKLYTCVDYRPKGSGKKAFKNVIQKIIETELVNETVVSVIEKNSLLNYENSLLVLNDRFNALQSVHNFEIVSIPLNTWGEPKNSFLRFRGGFWGEALVTKYFVDKGVSLAKKLFTKVGLSKEKIKKSLDDFPFGEIEGNERPTRPSGMHFPSVSFGQLGTPAALLVLSFVALQLVLPRNKKSNSKSDDDEGLIGTAKVLTTVLTGIKFPKKKIKTYWERMYDDTQEILYKMISPNQPYIWALLIFGLIWFNSRTLGNWFMESDTKYLGGRLAEQSKIIAAQAALYAEGLTNILRREQTGNDDYKAEVKRSNRAMEAELSQARATNRDLTLEGAEYRRIISVEQGKLTSCAREVVELLTYQETASEKLVNQQTTLVSLPNGDIATGITEITLVKARLPDSRYDIYEEAVVPVPAPKKKFFFA